MSEQAHHGNISWYKIFSVILAAFLTLFLLMLTQCTWKVMDATAVFNTFLCVVYAAFATLCFFISIAVCLVGADHAKHRHKPRRFYYFMLMYVLAVVVAFVVTEFF